MGPISGFTVALPFLLIILIYMVKQHELDHLKKKRKTELLILARLFKESFEKDEKGAGKSAQAYFIDKLREFEADGNLSKITCGILVSELLNETRNTN